MHGTTTGLHIAKAVFFVFQCNFPPRSSFAGRIARDKFLPARPTDSAAPSFPLGVSVDSAGQQRCSWSVSICSRLEALVFEFLALKIKFDFPFQPWLAELALVLTMRMNAKPQLSFEV